MSGRWKIIFAVIASLMGVGIGPVPNQSRQVVILMEGKMKRIEPQEQGLRDGLEELGYVRGEDVIFTRLNEVGYDRLRSKMLAHMRHQNIDLVIALGTTEAAVAMNVTRTIPIVFLPVADPVASGFVKSLAAPETNLTGLTFFTGPENIGKQLQVFSRVVPFLRQVTVLIDDGKGSRRNRWVPNGFSQVASRLGIKVTEAPVSTLADALRTVANLHSARRDHGIFVLCSGLFKNLKDIAAVTTKQKLALFGCNAFQVAEQNVLMSYAPDLYSLGYRGAWFVDRIFKGARPQNLPVETPRKFELMINNRVAEQIGLKIPSNVLRLADRIFK